jgi:hypothetical protein
LPGKQGSLRKTALLAMGIHAAIAKNKKEHCYEPIALKTMQDGYVQIVRAIIHTATGLHRLRDPFQGFRVRWPDNAKPSVKRESIDYETLDRVFRLGVDSGYFDDAVLGPLCLLSTRRIGILPWIRGTISGRSTGGHHPRQRNRVRQEGRDLSSRSLQNR